MAELIQLSTGGQQIDLKVDLIYSLSESLTKQVSRVPLEHGRSVGDNAVDEPTAVRLQGIVSEMSIAEGRDAGKPAQQWVALKELMRRNALFALATEMDIQSNMLITTLTRPENRSTGTSLQFDMTLTQVDFVDVEFSNVSPATVDQEGPAANRTSEVNRGVVNASNNVG